MSNKTKSFMRKFHEIARLIDISLCRNRAELLSVMRYLKRAMKNQAVMQH